MRGFLDNSTAINKTRTSINDPSARVVSVELFDSKFADLKGSEMSHEETVKVAKRLLKCRIFRDSAIRGRVPFQMNASLVSSRTSESSFA